MYMCIYIYIYVFVCVLNIIDVYIQIEINLSKRNIISQLQLQIGVPSVKGDAAGVLVKPQRLTI